MEIMKRSLPHASEVEFKAMAWGTFLGNILGLVPKWGAYFGDGPLLSLGQVPIWGPSLGTMPPMGTIFFPLETQRILRNSSITREIFDMPHSLVAMISTYDVSLLR